MRGKGDGNEAVAVFEQCAHIGEGVDMGRVRFRCIISTDVIGALSVESDEDQIVVLRIFRTGNKSQEQSQEGSKSLGWKP